MASTKKKEASKTPSAAPATPAPAAPAAPAPMIPGVGVPYGVNPRVMQYGPSVGGYYMGPSRQSVPPLLPVYEVPTAYGLLAAAARVGGASHGFSPQMHELMKSVLGAVTKGRGAGGAGGAGGTGRTKGGKPGTFRAANEPDKDVWARARKYQDDLTGYDPGKPGVDYETRESVGLNKFSPINPKTYNPLLSYGGPDPVWAPGEGPGEYLTRELLRDQLAAERAAGEAAKKGSTDGTPQQQQTRVRVGRDGAIGSEDVFADRAGGEAGTRDRSGAFFDALMKAWRDWNIGG